MCVVGMALGRDIHVRLWLVGVFMCWAGWAGVRASLQFVTMLSSGREPVQQNIRQPLWGVTTSDAVDEGGSMCMVHSKVFRPCICMDVVHGCKGYRRAHNYAVALACCAC